nr:hypothetical protein [Tanacetum cinerariifolium]
VNNIYREAAFSKIKTSFQSLDPENAYPGRFPNEESANVKTVHKDVQIRALVDGKKIIITEASIRRDLRLDNAEEFPCKPRTTYAIKEGPDI